MKYIIVSLLLIYSLSVMAQDHYKIYSTAKQKVVNTDDIINEMKKADVLFFGEEHDDSLAHVLELDILTKLNQHNPGRTALSMEMFETDCQLVLNEYLKGLIREKNFITDARAWPNYADYRPLIEFCKTQQIPVVAANAPARYTNMVNRLGLPGLQQLGPTAKSYLPPLPIDTATGVYYDKFIKIMGGHGSMPGMQLYQAQNLWDATMGWSIASFLKSHHKYKILQVNGGFHSEDKLGAAAQLKKYAPAARILNIALYSHENPDNPDWSKYGKDNDYIVLTE